MLIMVICESTVSSNSSVWGAASVFFRAYRISQWGDTVLLVIIFHEVAQNSLITPQVFLGSTNSPNIPSSWPPCTSTWLQRDWPPRNQSDVEENMLACDQHQTTTMPTRILLTTTTAAATTILVLPIPLRQHHYHYFSSFHLAGLNGTALQCSAAAFICTIRISLMSHSLKSKVASFYITVIKCELA